MEIGSVTNIDKYFDRGDFITLIHPSDCFAIWGGDVDKTYNAKTHIEELQYSLIAYYDPDNKVEDKGAYGSVYLSKPILSLPDLTDPMSDGNCDYIIDEDSVDAWRLCTQDEKIKFLKILASEHYGWNETACEIIKLKSNEIIKFDDENNKNNKFDSDSSLLYKNTVLKKKYYRQAFPILPMDCESEKALKEACSKYNLTNLYNSHRNEPNLFEIPYAYPDDNNGSFLTGVSAHNGYFDF